MSNLYKREFPPYAISIDEASYACVAMNVRVGVQTSTIVLTREEFVDMLRTLAGKLLPGGHTLTLFAIEYRDKMIADLEKRIWDMNLSYAALERDKRVLSEQFGDLQKTLTMQANRIDEQARRIAGLKRRFEAVWKQNSEVSAQNRELRKEKAALLERMAIIRGHADTSCEKEKQ